MCSPFSCIQGGAGVGKTTTVSEIIKEVKQVLTVVTVTFTHKAKRCVEKRLHEAGITDVTTSTIHSFIMRLKGMRFARILLLIDESSMVDLELMGELAKQMMEFCDAYQLCFVGDTMQLPSVGRGEIYRMMIDAAGPHVKSLVQCYRTDRADLFDAYQAIREGRLPPTSEHFKLELFDDDGGIDGFAAGFIARHSDAYMYVAWQNKDVARINKMVQAEMVKSGRVGPRAWGQFYMHDRVVYRGENKEHLTNAMTGTVVDVKSDGMTVKWDDCAEVTVFKKDARGVQLMYCGTCHIMQGSEYKQVCVLCYDIVKMIKCSDRKWIYTAVTRAQDNVVLAATRELDIFVAHQLADAPLSGLSF